VLRKKAQQRKREFDEKGNEIAARPVELEHRSDDGMFRYRTPFPDIRSVEDIAAYLKRHVFGRLDIEHENCKGLEVPSIYV